MADPIKKNYKRRHYFVEKRFQLRFAGLIIGFMFIVAFFSAFTIYYYTWMTLGEKLANVYPQGRLAGILRTANYILFIRIMVITPLVFIFAIVLSHRIAGPIFRIKRTVDDIINGNYKLRVTLRKTDELKDVADSINRLVDLLEEKDKKNRV